MIFKICFTRSALRYLTSQTILLRIVELDCHASGVPRKTTGLQMASWRVFG